MRRMIRWADADGRVAVGVELGERGRFQAVRGTDDPLAVLSEAEPEVDDVVVVALDPDTLALGDGLTLLAPLDPPEVWCAGVTYERSLDARMEESASRDVYADVYRSARPELFMKDAGARRTVGPGEAIGIRGDSAWNVPEPEIGLVLGTEGKILGYTIGNDVSSREIEGANPLYLAQAKIYAGACAIGPAVYAPTHEPEGLQIVMRITDEHGEALFEEQTTTAQMTRSFHGARVVARARQPGPARYRPPHGDGAGSPRQPQPRARAPGRDPRPGGRHARQPCRPRVHARLTAKEPR